MQIRVRMSHQTKADDGKTDSCRKRCYFATNNTTPTTLQNLLAGPPIYERTSPIHTSASRLRLPLAYGYTDHTPRNHGRHHGRRRWRRSNAIGAVVL